MAKWGLKEEVNMKSEGHKIGQKDGKGMSQRRRKPEGDQKEVRGRSKGDQKVKNRSEGGQKEIKRKRMPWQKRHFYCDIYCCIILKLYNVI